MKLKLSVSDLRRVFLEPIIMLYMLSIWIQFNLFLPLLNEKICQQQFGNAFDCKNLSSSSNETFYRSEIHRRSSNLLFYSNLCITLPSILIAPLLGILGDNFGRKAPAVVTALGALLSAVNYIVCIEANWSPEVLLVSSFLQGVSGGFSGCIMAVSSWAAVISSSARRTSRLALIEFANLIGTALAPILGGVIAKYSGYTAAFGFTIALNALAIFYILFFLVSPEDYSDKDDRDGQVRSRGMWNPKVQAKFLWSLLTDRRSRTIISVIMICLFCVWTVNTGSNEIRYNFLDSLNIGWDVLKQNILAADDSLVRGVTLITVLPLLKHRAHLLDFTIVLLGVLSKSANLIFFGCSHSLVMVFIAPILGLLAAAVSSCGRSLASKVATANDQGKLFGLLAVLENLASLTGSGIFQSIYRANREWFAGLPYVIGGVFLLLPAALVLFLYRRLRRFEIIMNEGHKVHMDAAETDLTEEATA